MPDPVMETMLARIDERTARTERDVAELKAAMSATNAAAAMSSAASSLAMASAINSLADAIERRFTLKVEFNPVRTIVFGMAGASLLTILGAILAYVVRAGGPR